MGEKKLPQPTPWNKLKPRREPWIVLLLKAVPELENNGFGVFFENEHGGKHFLKSFPLHDMARDIADALNKAHVQRTYVGLPPKEAYSDPK